MTDEDDCLQKARAGFEDLCRALNMDEEAASEAWKTYENINKNFTLEVNPVFNVLVKRLCRCRLVMSPPLSIFTITLLIALL